MRYYRFLITLFLFSAFSSSSLAKDNETQVLIKGNLLTPPPCKVNDGNMIEVNFGPVAIKTIKGYDQKREINYQINCEENLNNWNMYLSIDGKKSSFDPNGLRTNINELAVKFMMGDSIIDLNKKYSVNLNNPEKIWAVLVKKENSELTPGNFTSGGTLFVEYQ